MFRTPKAVTRLSLIAAMAGAVCLANPGPAHAQATEGVKQTLQTQVRTQAPVKWTVPEATKVAINSSHSNIKNMIATLDELDKTLDADKSNAGARINNTKSNVKNLTASLSGIEEILAGLETKEKNAALSEPSNKMAATNIQFLALQESLNVAGRQYSTISNVLKTRHDTVKNSIGNIR